MAKKRNSASNIAVWIILGLLIVGLAGFGGTSFLGGVSSVASVGNRDIDVNRYVSALQQEIQQMSRQFGQQLNFAQIQMFGIDQMVLQRLLTTAALENEANDAGISAGDSRVRDQLLEMTAFQGVDGSFDRDGYAIALRQANLSEREFEESLRSDIARTLLVQSVAGGATMPPAYIEAILAYQFETRAITWTVLEPGDLDSPLADPSDEELRAHWEAEEASFMLPETREISYAWLTPAMIADTIEVDDAALLALYEERADIYNLPERRLVERLVFASEEAAAEALGQIEAGEVTFEDLVAERGLDLADIDLGDVTEGDLGPAAEAVFALTEPGIAGPVATDLGGALFRMNGILPAQTTSFDEARDTLLAEYQLEEARRVLGTMVEEVDDLLAGGAEIEELAAETELEAGEISWSEGATDGIASLPEFRQAAVSTQEGDFPEVIQASDGSLFSIRVNDVIAPRVEPFDEAREAVLADWQRLQTVVALAAQAEALAAEMPDAAAEEVEALGDILDLPELDTDTPTPDTDGPAFNTETALARDGFVPDTPTGFVDAVFEMEIGETRVIEGVTAAYLLRLDTVNAADLASDTLTEQAEALEARLAGTLGEDVLNAFAGAVQDNAGITLNQAAINAVHQQLSGGTHGGM